MRRVIFAILLLMFLQVVPSAYAVFVPEWQGLEGTTYQEWRFDSNDNPAVPEVIDNDYGDASASITVGVMGSGWLDSVGTRTGIWDIDGEGGQIVLDIDNRPLALDYKEIWIQVIYYEGPTTAPIVSVPGADFISSQTVLVEPDEPWAWYLEQTIWRIEPNPSYEQIILTGNPDWGSVIDQIVVDTYCIPEPMSIALLSLGSLIVLRKRQ